MASRSAASATSAARSVTSGSRAPTSSLRPSWRVRSDEDTSRARDGLLPNESLDFAPKSLPRAVARIEHVAAGIDHELDPLRCEGRQLVEHPLRSEIGGGEIEQAVRDQHVQLRIRGEDLAQLGDRLRRVDAAAEIPGTLDGAVQHLVGAIGPPIELVCQQVNRGTRQRRLQRIAGGITEPRAARIRIGIEAAYRAIVAPRHLAVLAVEFAAEFADVEAAGKPAAHRLVDAGELGDLVGKTIGRLLVRLALDEVGQEFAARVSLDVGEIGALDRAFRLARHRDIARQRRDILQEAGAGELAEVQERRHQDQSPDADAVLKLQLPHYLRPANATIAFAGDVFWRGQPVVLLEPAADHERDRIDVTVNGVERFARVIAGRDEPAIASADGIDKDEIGEIEPGLRVRLH